jgi:hypothetical protein
MTDTKLPANATPDDPYAELADLILQTPGAQTREEALAHIAAREQAFSEKLAKPKTPPSEDQLTTPEPLPIVNEPDQFAAGFFERLRKKTKATQKDKPKAKPTPKRSRPRLVVDNDNPDPADKK